MVKYNMHRYATLHSYGQHDNRSYSHILYEGHKGMRTANVKAKASGMSIYQLTQGKSASNFLYSVYKKTQLQDTPITAGSEGVAGRTKSQTVKLSFSRIEKFEVASSSIISTVPLSVKKSENDGEAIILCKDIVADFTLST